MERSDSTRGDRSDRSPLDPAKKYGSGSRGLCSAGGRNPPRGRLPDQIEDLDVAEMVATVGAATPVKILREQALKKGLIVCGILPDEEGTIGGLFSDPREGASDTCTGRFRDHVLGIEGVRGDGGPILSGGRVVKNVTGYDLTRLLGGAMGALGVVTRLHLRLEAAPSCWNIIRWDFHNDEPCWRRMDRLRSLPFEPHLICIEPLKQRVVILLSGTVRSVEEKKQLIVNLAEEASTRPLDGEELMQVYAGLRADGGQALRVRARWQDWRTLLSTAGGDWKALFPAAGFGLVQGWQRGDRLDQWIAQVQGLEASVTAEDVLAEERSGIPLVAPDPSDVLTRKLRSHWDPQKNRSWHGDRQ
ncbi:MAG: FAD-binding oxidoreductase [Planctomycetota bacterium]|nr:FAD-binding oxidoreductase [Planctomycetota bacterium]